MGRETTKQNFRIPVELWRRVLALHDRLAMRAAARRERWTVTQTILHLIEIGLRWAR